MELYHLSDIVLLAFLFIHALCAVAARSYDFTVSARVLRGVLIAEAVVLLIGAALCYALPGFLPNPALLALVGFGALVHFILWRCHTIRKDKVYSMYVTNLWPGGSEEEKIAFGEIRADGILIHVAICGNENCSGIDEYQVIPVTFKAFNMSRIDYRYDVEVEPYREKQC